MKFRMIVCDLDHTLLHSDQSITAETCVVLEEFVKRGVRICIASGRGLAASTIMLSASKPYSE